MSLTPLRRARHDPDGDSPRTVRASLAAAALALGLTWTMVPGGLLWAPDAHGREPVSLVSVMSHPNPNGHVVPYRFARPPLGYLKTGPPTPAVGRLRADDGVSDRTLDVASSEKPPQVQIHLPAGGLRGASATRGFDVRAVPSPPGAGPAPGGGLLEGNIYRLTIEADPPAPVTLAGRAEPWITLRAVQDTSPGPSFVYRRSPDDPWRQLVTHRVDHDIYVTRIAGPGDYALARAPGTADGNTVGASRSGSRPSPQAVLLFAVPAALLGAVAVAVRRPGSRRRIR